MKRTIIRFLIPLLIVCAGCSSRKSVVEPTGYKLGRKVIKKLETKATGGDGEAAYQLYWYYCFSYDGTVQLMDKYHKLAVDLEYPDALYNEALWEWTRKQSPDISYVEKMLNRALELGKKDDYYLAEAVKLARETGVIPEKFHRLTKGPGFPTNSESAGSQP